MREDDRQLDGRVEIDDAYLGGERSGGKTGRGSENKVPFVAAVQTTPDGQPQFVCLRQQPFTHEEVSVFAARSIAPSATVISDGLWCFGAVQIVGADHERVVTGGGKASTKLPQFKAINTFLGNLKRSLEWHVSRLRLRQVRPSLPRRGPISIQPSLQSALHLGSPAARRLPLNSSPGRTSFVWLRLVANQEGPGYCGRCAGRDASGSARRGEHMPTLGVGPLDSVPFGDSTELTGDVELRIQASGESHRAFVQPTHPHVARRSRGSGGGSSRSRASAIDARLRAETGSRRRRARSTPAPDANERHTPAAITPDTASIDAV